ncbi:MAG: type II secretion system F family protein [Pseudomonadota bacterium]
MDQIFSAQGMAAIATFIAVFAAILSFVMPMIQKDPLAERMKSVALEREQLRARERARLSAEKQQGKRGSSKKKEANGLAKQLVDGLNLKSALADQATEDALIHAGFRGQAPLFTFLALRFGLPFLFGGLASLYVFVLADFSESDLMVKVAIIGGAAYAGFIAPMMFVNNKKTARQLSITMAWPDALDLCLICVESGMSIEAAFRKVAAEIGPQSVELAEELMITTAELSYLSERRMAYDNLVKRTGLDTVKNVVLSLVQAEKYGTPLSAALRVLSQENRDERMNKAETKAQSLPPKLTVPMMVCFLPVLFAVIMGPAIIGVMETMSGPGAP